MILSNCSEFYQIGTPHFSLEGVKVNATRGKLPWAKNEPSGDGSCAVMYGHFKQNNGLLNDLRCDIYRGYICESLTKSTDQEGMSYKVSRYLFRQTISKSKFVYDSLKWLLDRECTEITEIEFNKDKNLLVLYSAPRL